MKTEWNLGLLYKNDKDPQIEKDIIVLEQACTAFEKKYKNKDFTATAQSLFSALKDYQVLSDKIIGKSWAYFALKSDLDSANSSVSAAATRIEQRMSLATNKLTFFSLVIGKVSSSKQKIFLEDPILEPFRYKLEKLFKRAKYMLTEQEEQLADLLSQPAFGMWVDAQDRILTQKMVKHKGEELPLPKALSIISDLPKKERHVLSDAVNAVLEAQSSVAEAEINAIYNYKKIMDERRGYKKPYSATVLGYENEEKEVEALIAMVTKNFTLSQRFYSLHAKLLGEKKIIMADRAVKIGTIKKKFDFDSAVSLVKSAFEQVDASYAGLLDTYVEKGQIDVFPKKGKRGGAYCWGYGTLPTFVLLNHTNDIKSVETLAHEMGHAIHSESVKPLPPQYRGYSTATAEVASTFFEQLVTDQLEQTLSDEEKVILLHNKILGDISTIFRQVACFNFELDLHTRIRAEGQVNGGDIAELLQKHLQSYTGKAMNVTKNDGYFYVNWSHIRRFFYVYSYAYGQLVSRALYEKWKADPSYAKKIEQFLKAGRSMSPKDIFKSIGINTNEAFFEAGLKGIEADIDKLEKLSKNWLKKQKKK
ncbi:MAG TPA: M3 family metallopeptidase [Candidatus Paceibacterota bacterium]